MPTIRLVPSAYAVSSTSYLSVSNPSNAYTNTDSTNYATVTNTYTSTTSRYYYLRGFNFGDIPADATINSFTVKIKGYESRLSTSTSYAPRLANGTSAISNTTASSNFGTSVSTITIPTGSLTWQQIANYGSDFTILVYVKRSSKNTTGYFYCYGAEIEVNYTLPVTYDVDASSTASGVTVSPSSQSVSEGDSATVTFDGINNLSDVIVTDNNTDVTSSLVYHQYTNPSYSVGSVTGASYGFALSSGWYESQNKGVNNSAALCRVNISSVVQCRVTFTYINYAEATYDFGIFSKADTALTLDYPVSTSQGGDTTIDNGLYEKRCNSSSDNSSSQRTLQYTLAAGEHFIDVKFGKDEASNEGNDSLRFQVSITALEPIPTGGYYTYTISNIQADHTVLVSSAQVEKKLYIKKQSNGTYLGGDTSSNYDSHSLVVPLSSGTIVEGDMVRIVLSNVRRWYSGQYTQIPYTDFTFERTIGSNVIYYYASGTSGIGIQFYQVRGTTGTGNIEIRPYDSRQTSAGYDGRIEVYKMTDDIVWTEVTEVYIKRNGSWATVSKVYKKSSNSWTQLEDPHLMFDPNAIFISGL